MSMADTQLSITLPEDVLAQLRAYVASGQFESESAVLREAFEDLANRDRSYEEHFQRWWREEGVAGYEEWKSNPDDVSDIADVRARIKARREAEDRAA